MKKHFLLLLLAGALAAPAVAQTDSTGTGSPLPDPNAPATTPWKLYTAPPAPDRRAERAAEREAERPATPAATAAPSTGSPRRTPQGSTYVPLDVDVYRLIDRYALKAGADSLLGPHTSVRPYSRVAVARLAEQMLRDSASGLSRADRFNLRYLLRDNWNYTPQAAAYNNRPQPSWRYFYRKASDAFSVESPDFTLRVNPVLGVQAGFDNRTDGLRYLNTRGLQVEGTIDGRLAFYTFLADNQMAVPAYVQTRIERDSIVPHEAFLKRFKNKPDQYDFFSARGYLSYAATRHISVQLGHDRNVIGNGYRSLILSDYAAPYFFLKLNTRVWKLNYQNLFAELNATAVGTNQVYPKKYLALHHLSLDVTPSFNVGVFESVMFARGRGRFELQYLNPIIFYRSVEQQVGSGDNALLGADFKWNIRQRVQLYGQLMLDEFVLGEVRAGNGWKNNKQAVQLGGKYVDVAGIRNLDLQAEFNYVRPYTYQHLSQYTNYQHYRQPLAHPMGANLYELIGIVSYQPLPRLSVVAKGFYSKQGLDLQEKRDFPPYTVDINSGGNVLYPYTSGPEEYGNRVGQGNTTHLLHADFTATYQLYHNLWLDAKQIVRRQTNSVPVAGTGTEAFSAVTLRWNIAQRLQEF